MKTPDSFSTIQLHLEAVDFRKGRFSLAQYVQNELKCNFFTSSLFIFRNRTRRTIRMLYWDKTGIAMWEKGLDQEKFPWPKKVTELTISVSSAQLEMLLEGIDFSKIKRHKPLNCEVV